MEQQKEVQTYTYDSFGQLIRENNEGLDKTILYCYNDIGNIVSAETFGYTTGAVTPGTGTIQNYTYDTTYPDRLKSFNGKGITYNSLHCPINYDGKSWTWTNGKLTRVRRGSASQPGSEYKDCTFTYDGYGRRIRKHYIYDPNPAVAGDGNYYYEINYEYDEGGRLIRELCTTHYDNQTESTREFVFLYDESGIIGTLYSLNGSGPSTYYYRRNLQGDVIAIYDQYGSRKAEYAYDAFGNCTVLYAGLADLANNNPIRYRGYYYDKETNLYYLNSRYYNPEWRRFISPDSTGYLDPESINGLNLYAYCNNDPVNYVDPSGHSAFLIAMSVLAVAGLITTGIGMATDNNLVTAIGLTAVAAPALISGGMAFSLLTPVGLGVGISTAVAGVGTALFASAEYQEAFTHNNWMLDAGMSEGWYNGLMLTAATIATLGTAASSVAYGFNIKSIHKFGKFRKYGQEGYYGIKYTTKTGKTRVLSLHTHSHIPGKTISQWHWQLQKWNPRANEVASTVSSWYFWTLIKMRGVK